MVGRLRTIFSLIFAILIVFVPSLLLLDTKKSKNTRSFNPWHKVAKKPAPTPHDYLFKAQSFSDGPSVTKACLNCHPNAAKEVMQTSHWTWLGEEVVVSGHKKPLRIGKRNLINNFCISIEGNWPKCTTCHAGYGWKDQNFDFTDQKNVDCLVCHDHSGGYSKTINGLPADGVDLLAAAKSVGRPTRDNCGWCHFNGGGGNAVKHGDLDGSLAKPVERIDVHMGKHNFQCIDCHRTRNHKISGGIISVSARNTIGVKCTDCHSTPPHLSDRLNQHLTSVACQTCHIPVVATKEPTKIAWDWSTAGKNIKASDPHKYLKIKGSFLYARELIPEYYWFNGDSARYIKGDMIDPQQVTNINFPMGRINDPLALIWPFKIHHAKQPYDIKHRYLLVPKTVGEGGYWTEFDWQKAVKLGSKYSGLAFSGKLGFAETRMFWVLSHMVTPKEYALQCTDCHGENGRLNWRKLGYSADPALAGGRSYKRVIASGPWRD
ncbi:MAG: tetrathionate reductase family octaheme c-type cytochrome [Desulfobacterales bacterium]